MQTACAASSLRAALPQRRVAAPRTRRSSVIVRADYLGSATNQIMVLSTMLPIVAGRFGLAPTANRHTTAGLKLYEDKSAGLASGDPAGYTAVDVLALGALGHVIGVGIVLGLKATGNL